MMNDIPFLEMELGVFNGQHNFLHMAKIPIRDLILDAENRNLYADFVADMMFQELKGVYVEHMGSYCAPSSKFRSIFHFCMSMCDGKNLYLYFYKPQFFDHEKRHYPELLELSLIDNAQMMWWPAQHHNVHGVHKYDSDIVFSSQFFCHSIDELVNFMSTIGYDRLNLTERIEYNQKGTRFMRLSDE